MEGWKIGRAGDAEVRKRGSTTCRPPIHRFAESPTLRLTASRRLPSSTSANAKPQHVNSPRLQPRPHRPTLSTASSCPFPNLHFPTFPIFSVSHPSASPTLGANAPPHSLPRVRSSTRTNSGTLHCVQPPGRRPRSRRISPPNALLNFLTPLDDRLLKNCRRSHRTGPYPAPNAIRRRGSPEDENPLGCSP